MKEIPAQNSSQLTQVCQIAWHLFQCFGEHFWMKCQVTDIESKHKGEELHPLPPLCLSHCALSPSPAPTVLPAKSKMDSFTPVSLSLFQMFCLPLEKERREGHTVMRVLPLPQGEFPNSAMSHFPVNPAAVPIHAKKAVKSLCQYLDQKN